jgi:hypothetical protein
MKPTLENDSRYPRAEIDQRLSESKNPTAMKTLIAILLTLTWLASWTGIALGLAGCLAPPAPLAEPVPILAAVER